MESSDGEGASREECTSSGQVLSRERVQHLRSGQRGGFVRVRAANVQQTSRGQLIRLDQILSYLYAGHAVVTFLNSASGNRFTYQVSEPRQQLNPDNPVFFVSVLSGRDNTRDFLFLGTIFSQRVFKPGRRVDAQAPSVQAFQWVFDRLREGRTVDPVVIYHEGRCGRCGRVLTVPESIESGFGPECRQLREGAG